MQRLGTIAAVAVLFTLPVGAQQRMDPSRCFPIQGQVRDAGTLDVTTGRWTRTKQAAKAGTTIVYNNTCTWLVGSYYAAVDWCEEIYDEGRIPSPSAPNAPAGATTDNLIQSVQVSYCTFVGPLAATGGYDMDVAFWDNLGGNCVGVVPPTPPPVSSTATAYFPLAGLGLPGSTAFGFQACWIVTLDVSNTGMVLASDGDGVFGNGDDEFNWMQRQNTTVGALQILGTPDGFFVRGEPLTGGYGACTYSIPCGTDGFSGSTCGTGLDTYDAWWINVDGIGIGDSGQPAGCANSVAQYGLGTNCYFTGGYPQQPLLSTWLILKSDARDACICSGYCDQVKPTSVPGCKALLTATNSSLATGVWTVNDIPSAGPATVVGIFIYTDGVGIGPSSFNATVPFGTLCLAGFKRSAPTCVPAFLMASAGCNVGPMTLSPNCNGGALGIAVGEDVNVQFWFRDPGGVGNADFSNAIFYTVQ